MEKVEYSESTSATIKQILKDANLASKKYWKVNASPKIWDMQKLLVGGVVDYDTNNKCKKNYEQAKKGELVLGYKTGDKIIVSLLVVSQPDDGSKIYFKKILEVQPEFLNLEEVNSNPITKDAFIPYQTTFKDISMDVFAEIISMMIQKGVLTLADRYK